MPRMYDVAMNSPASQKATVGAIVITYTAAATPLTANHPTCPRIQLMLALLASYQAPADAGAVPPSDPGIQSLKDATPLTDSRRGA